MNVQEASAQRIALQRRTVLVLALGQVLGGIAFGATVSLGALLAEDISGEQSLSGFATASVTLGAAFAAIPLARLAARSGRRRALTIGNLFALVGIVIVILSAELRLFPLLIAGILLIGAGNAGNLQSRFAATDLALPERRGRDLSLVVWATTVGGVSGPLLLTPGEAVGAFLGMPSYTGAYVFSIAAQCAAFVLYLVALRPDPLREAQKLNLRVTQISTGGEDRPRLVRYAILAIAASHIVMVSVMAMTPVHLSHMAHAAHGGAASAQDVTLLVGVTIALHVAGMYGLSPVFGMLADRWGALRVVLLGQGILAVSLLFAIFANDSGGGVMVALVLLGLGWSAGTVAGATLLTQASAPERRTARQGLSDSLMSLSAGLGAVGAGIVLSAFGYAGLGVAAFVPVLLVVGLAVWGRGEDPAGESAGPS